MMTMKPLPQVHSASGNDPNCSGGFPDSEILCALVSGGEIALVRIVGRGSHMNVAGFKAFSEKIQGMSGVHKFVLDLDPCETMDSTFLGVLASVALRQKSSGCGSLIVLNANTHVQRILKTMGLIHVLDLRQTNGVACKDFVDSEGALRPAESPEMSRLDQICVRLQAHRDLADLDPENRVRFESVISFLEHSLEREKAKTTG